MSDFKIRAHHAMCLQFFCGKGYNNPFIENMKNIYDSLSENPMVTIIDYGDDICSECPNCVDANCCEQEKVRHYDSKVLEYCSIKSGSTMYWNNLRDAVYKNILSVHKRNLICKDCKWDKICNSYNTKEKSQ